MDQVSQLHLTHVKHSLHSNVLCTLAQRTKCAATSDDELLEVRRRRPSSRSLQQAPELAGDVDIDMGMW